MNRKLLSKLMMAAALNCSLLAQPAAVYQNDDTLLVPPAVAPNIDAVSFVNRGKFIINFTNQSPFVPELPPPVGLPPYETQNTLNYSNFFGRFMSCNTGFRMEYYNSQTSQRQRAASFYNDGVINSGTIDTTNYFIGREAFFGSTNLFLIGTIAGSKFMVSATNIHNPGVINLGFEGLLNMRGSSVNFSGGTVTAEPEGFGIASGANIGFFFNQGIFDGYWGVGDVRSQLGLFYPFGISPAAFFESNPPQTTTHPVTTRNQAVQLQTLIMSNSPSYVMDEFDFSGSNRTVRVVFLGNTNANVQANVYFPTFPDIAVEFTNTLGTASNNLYVLDYFGVETNLNLVLNGISQGQFTLIPFNYFVLFENPAFMNPFLGPPVSPSAVPPGTFNATATTNQWSAYQAILQPLSLVLADNAGQDVTNLPGRIEIVGEDYLDLSRSRISSLNYLALKAPNHFAGSSRAQISSPFVDVNLRSTNGLLTITNLLAPVLSKPEGTIDLYSARWTNVTFTLGRTVTNRYHVLFADARFSSTTPSRLQEAVLRSTNNLGGADQIVINDVMNVTRSLLLDATSVTIDTNAPGSPNAAGFINLENSSTIWPGSTPRLKYFTNNGAIQTVNTVFFGGSRSSPYYSTNFNEPYEAFINRGTVNTFASLIWAKTFFNSGTFMASFGDIDLQHGLTTSLADGAFVANGDISINSSSLSISNHILQSGGALTFSITNYLDDGSVTNSLSTITNKNTWTTGNGVNLLTLPARGSLLASTVFATALSRDVANRWAASDRGPSAIGFSNNAALGRLILNGETDRPFTFTGTSVSNAMYIDYLDLRNFATNIDNLGNLSSMQINPGIVIYYAQAVAGEVSVAERLDFSSGGRLRWVPEYAGFYSSTNLVYPDNSTNALNSALVLSQNLDSDGDGVVNAADPTPVFLITTASLPDATNAAPYSIPLVAFGGPAAATYSWSLAPGSALPPGLSLSPAGVVSGTPTETGEFTFTVRASVTTPGGVLTADRELALTVQASTLALVMALESGFSPSARVSWVTAPNSTNYVYFRSSLTAGNWQLLTNFVSSTGGPVSIWDPLGTNKTRSYRVQVDSPKP